MINTIWVDADACPVVIKEMLFRAAERTQIQTTLVANQAIRIPPSPFISFLRVSARSRKLQTSLIYDLIKNT